jgi:hypothetical protein
MESVHNDGRAQAQGDQGVLHAQPLAMRMLNLIWVDGEPFYKG